MTTLTIRQAEVADGPSIARVHVQTWQESYAQHFPADFLDGLADVIKVEIWESTIEDESIDVLVAEVDGEIVGWANASSVDVEDVPASRELLGLYVVQAQHGEGVAQALLDRILGTSSACLWVLENNPRAEAFYRRNGFRRDGSSTVRSFADQAMSLVRMVRGY